MIPRLTRLLPRIYFVSLAQLLSIVAAVVIIGFLSWSPERGPDFARRGRYVVDTLTPHLADPEALERELLRARKQLKVEVSLYADDGTLIATNVEPPLAPATRRQQHPTPKGRWHMPHAPEPLRIAFAQGNSLGAFAMYRPPPPPQPRESSLWTVGFALFATGVASILLARSFARPLAQLSAAAQRFGAGDLDARAGLTRRDEFGELSHVFDEMAARVTQLVRSRQQLLANVSHELRTPLARIRVALDLASDGVGGVGGGSGADGNSQAELAYDVLTEIAEDCAELERLVNDVLQTARLDLTGQSAQVVEQRLHKETFDVASIVRRSIERFRSEHPGRTLELEIPDALPELYGDQVLLRRVFSNLLDNAQKYSPETSPISLQVSAQAKWLEVRIVDRGIGMAPADLAQVGTPFFRSDRSRTRRTGGVGLGISLARSIVEAHAGTLNIESELDRGTSVCVRLPTKSTL